MYSFLYSQTCTITSCHTYVIMVWVSSLGTIMITDWQRLGLASHTSVCAAVLRIEKDSPDRSKANSGKKTTVLPHLCVSMTDGIALLATTVTGLVMCPHDLFCWSVIKLLLCGNRLCFCSLSVITILRRCCDSWIFFSDPSLEDLFNIFNRQFSKQSSCLQINWYVFGSFLFSINSWSWPLPFGSSYCQVSFAFPTCTISVCDHSSPAWGGWCKFHQYLRFPDMVGWLLVLLVLIADVSTVYYPFYDTQLGVCIQLWGHSSFWPATERQQC